MQTESYFDLFYGWFSFIDCINKSTFVVIINHLIEVVLIKFNIKIKIYSFKQSKANKIKWTSKQRLVSEIRSLGRETEIKKHLRVIRQGQAHRTIVQVQEFNKNSKENKKESKN
jgi:hypothetical protein